MSDSTVTRASVSARRRFRATRPPRSTPPIDDLIRARGELLEMFAAVDCGDVPRLPERSDAWTHRPALVELLDENKLEIQHMPLVEELAQRLGTTGQLDALVLLATDAERSPVSRALALTLLGGGDMGLTRAMQRMKADRVEALLDSSNLHFLVTLMTGPDLGEGVADALEACPLPLRTELLSVLLRTRHLFGLCASEVVSEVLRRPLLAPQHPTALAAALEDPAVDGLPELERRVGAPDSAPLPAAFVAAVTRLKTRGVSASPPGALRGAAMVSLCDTDSEFLMILTMGLRADVFDVTTLSVNLQSGRLSLRFHGVMGPVGIHAYVAALEDRHAPPACHPYFVKAPLLEAIGLAGEAAITEPTAGFLAPFAAATVAIQRLRGRARGAAPEPTTTPETSRLSAEAARALLTRPELGWMPAMLSASPSTAELAAAAQNLRHMARWYRFGGDSECADAVTSLAHRLTADLRLVRTALSVEAS